MDDLARRLPAAPLKLELSRARRARRLTWGELAGWLGVSPRTVARVMASIELSEDTADRLAIALGLHPVLLWPEEWPLGVDGVGSTTGSQGERR